MYDGGKIVPGLILFLGLLLTPFWYNAGAGRAAAKPEIVKPVDEKACVEPAEFMRANHMRLLIDWREDAVRGGDLLYVAGDGRKHDKSLSNNCMKCHSNKEEFCDRCHDYAQVKPNCWDCHTVPKEGK
ncbi:MAG: sulfate reduction electron transfer complex DsrMKJOP subunit DsrJ [Sphingomonadaceae bacterium]